MKNPWFIPAATLVVGGLGGFLAGKNISSAPVANDPDMPQGPASTRSGGRAATASDAARSQAGNRVRSTDDAYRTPGASNRTQALMDFYSGLSPAQLQAEAEKLEDLGMPERFLSSFLLFSRWGETDPLAAMDAATKMGWSAMFARPTILQSWASKDPEGAAKYYAEHFREFTGGMMGGRGPGGGGGASTIASEWARRDPEAALAWARTLEGGEKSSAMSGLINQIAGQDPAKAWAMVGEMDERSQGRTYRDLARRWGSEDYAEVDRLIAGLPADQQAEARASALEGLAKKDLNQALTKLSSIPEGEARNDATGVLVNQMARTDAKGAANWLLANAPAEAQRNGIESIMPNYVNQDPKGALIFAQGIPAGENRDAALSSYVFSNRAAPPAERVMIAESIGNEDSRNRTIRMTSVGWMMEDATAANAYIQASPAFDDDMKKRAAEGRPPIEFGRGRGGR